MAVCVHGAVCVVPVWGSRLWWVALVGGAWRVLLSRRGTALHGGSEAIELVFARRTHVASSADQV